MLLPERYEELERIHNATFAQRMGAVAVTAANPDEGVSTLVRAMARRNLLAGRSTLVVDLNLYRPSLHHSLQDLRVEENETWPKPPELVMSDDDDSVLTGVCAPKSRDIILKLREPGTLEAQIKDWLSEYDSVIFDTSPLSQINGANIPATRVASACDACVMVVMAGETSQAIVDSAVKQLQQADVNLIGCVLNDRFNPKLKDELLREVRRIQKRLPKISRWLTEKIQGQRLLALDV